MEKLQGLRAALEQARRDMEEAERAYDLNKVAELRYGKIPTLETQLKELESQPKDPHAARMFKEEVSTEEIADIVSRWTGIPVSRLLEGERQKLLRLDALLHERV